MAATNTMFGYNLGVTGRWVRVGLKPTQRWQNGSVEGEEGDELFAKADLPTDEGLRSVKSKVGGNFPTPHEAEGTNEENVEYACALLAEWFRRIKTRDEVTANVAFVSSFAHEMLSMRDSYVAEAMRSVDSREHPKGTFARDLLTFMLTAKKVHTLLEANAGKIGLPSDTKRMVVVDFMGEDSPSKIFRKALSDGTEASLSVYSPARCKRMIKDWKRIGKREPLTWGKGQNMVAQAKRLRMVIDDQFGDRLDSDVIAMHKCSTLAAKHGFPFVSTFGLDLHASLSMISAPSDPPRHLPYRFNNARKFTFLPSGTETEDRVEASLAELGLDDQEGDGSNPKEEEERRLLLCAQVLEEWWRRVRVREDVFAQPDFAARSARGILRAEPLEFMEAAFEALVMNASHGATKVQKGTFSRDYPEFLLLARKTHALLESGSESLAGRLGEGKGKKLLLLDYRGGECPRSILDREAKHGDPQVFTIESIDAQLADPRYSGTRVQLNLLKLNMLKAFSHHPEGAVLVMHLDNELSARHAFPFDATLQLKTM